MAYLRMPLGSAIFMTLLSISYVTGLTDMVGSHAELAAVNITDMTHMRGFELKIRLSDPQWFSEGMQISAFTHLDFYWKKRALTWALTKRSTVLKEGFVITALREAFAKWAEVSRFTFNQTTWYKPDIRVKFVAKEEEEFDSMLTHEGDYLCKDRSGVTIQFTDSELWMSGNDGGVAANFKFVALYEIGHALGLGDSQDSNAVMYEGFNPGISRLPEPQLGEDDKNSIRAKYPPETDEALGSASDDDYPRKTSSG